MVAVLRASDVAAALGDWTHRGSLYDGLAEALADLIRDGTLPPETRLPAERRLAETLHLSRSTVKAAYDRLVEMDMVSTRHGSGTVILAEASPLSGPREARVVASFDPRSVYSGVLRLPDGAIDMRGAYWVGAESIDRDRVLRAHEELQQLALNRHGYSPQGVLTTREAIADHLTGQGLPTTPDEVLVTTGAQQALSLIADVLLDAGDRVAVEEITYPSAMDYIRSRQAQLVPVPFGPAGVDVRALDRTVTAARPRMTLLITDVHNPTGVVLPGGARHLIAEAAHGWDTTIIDDRTLAETRFDDGADVTPLGALMDADGRGGRILTLGSCSKIAWGGLRVGWIRGDRATIERLVRVKTLTDLGTPVFDQLLAADLLRDPDTVPRRRRELRERYDALSTSLAEHLPGWEVPEPQGGMCVWARVPGTDTDAFARTATAHGVAISPGSVASATRATTDRLRLPFGHPPEVLREAVLRLASAYEAHREQELGWDPAAAVV